MATTKEIYFYQCGKCEDGEIKFTHRINGSTNSIRIEKCTKCKHEYGLKAVQQLTRKPHDFMGYLKRFVKDVLAETTTDLT